MGIDRPKKIGSFEDLIKAMRECVNDDEKFTLANQHIKLPQNLWHIGDLYAQISHIFDNRNQKRAQVLLSCYAIEHFDTTARSQSAQDEFKFQCAFRLKDYFKEPSNAAAIAISEAIKNQEMKARSTAAESSESLPKITVAKPSM